MLDGRFTWIEEGILDPRASSLRAHVRRPHRARHADAPVFAGGLVQGGRKPAYGDLHELFIPGAKLIRNNSETPEISSVEEFIRPRRKTVDAGELTSFEEVEVAEITEIFGNVAHRFSTYTKRGATNAEPIDARGMIRRSSSARRAAGR